MKENRYEIAIMAMLDILNYRDKIQDEYRKIQTNLTLAELKKDTIDKPLMDKAMKELLKKKEIKLAKSEYVGNSLMYHGVGVNLHNITDAKQRTDPNREVLKRIIGEVGLQNILNS